MNDKWKESIKKLSLSLIGLNENQQYYIVGLAEGMVISNETLGARNLLARQDMDSQRDKQLQEA